MSAFVRETSGGQLPCESQAMCNGGLNNVTCIEYWVNNAKSSWSYESSGVRAIAQRAKLCGRRVQRTGIYRVCTFHQPVVLYIGVRPFKDGLELCCVVFVVVLPQLLLMSLLCVPDMCGDRPFFAVPSWFYKKLKNVSCEYDPVNC